jgi:hypothetical protein
MDNKTLLGIIFLLLFILIIVVVFNKNQTRDTLEMLEHENNTLNQEIENTEELNQELRLKLTNKESESELYKKILTDSYINLALLNNAEIDGESLKLDLIYVRETMTEDWGFMFVQVERETTEIITKEVPIYLYGEGGSHFVQVDWEYLTNLKQKPILQLFQSLDGKSLYIREEYIPIMYQENVDLDTYFKGWEKSR